MLGGILNFGTSAAGIAAERAATAAYIPNQVVPYAETYNLTVQHTIGSNYTLEVGYLGTRGIHLPTQDQINRQAKVTAANQLPTNLLGGTVVSSAPGVQTLGKLNALSNIVPAYLIPRYCHYSSQRIHWQDHFLSTLFRIQLQRRCRQSHATYCEFAAG